MARSFFEHFLLMNLYLPKICLPNHIVQCTRKLFFGINMVKRTFIVICLFFVFLLLSVFSEVLYAKNIPSLVASAYLGSAKLAARSNRSQDSMKNIAHAAEYNLNLPSSTNFINKYVYGRLDHTIYPKPLYDFINPYSEIPDENSFGDGLDGYMAKFPLGSLIKGDYDLARIYYDLGIIAYRSHNEYLVPRLLMTSINLNRAQEVWYLELANFYYRYDQIKEADYILSDCLYNASSTASCRDFLGHIEKKEYPLDTGFLVGQTDKSYGFPSQLE